MTTATLSAETPVRDRFSAARAAWRSILVHVQPELEARPRLLTAADLARRLDATLIGVAAEMIPPMATSDPYGVLGGDFIGALADAVQTNLANARSAFDAEPSHPARECVALQDRPADAMERLARGADLIVAGGSPLAYRDGFRWADPAELVIKSGKPVLVAPPKGGPLAAESVVVAWKDSREARRALADALPILAAAETVTVVETVEEPDRDRDILETHHASLRTHLQRHGITARSRILKAHGEETADVLQSAARDAGADLIVCGAYGHSRLGEWVFGGVTASLLANPQSFVLFSH